jgi:hypothetical protein
MAPAARACKVTVIDPQLPLARNACGRPPSRLPAPTHAPVDPCLPCETAPPETPAPSPLRPGASFRAPFSSVPYAQRSPPPSWWPQFAEATAAFSLRTCAAPPAAP